MTVVFTAQRNEKWKVVEDRGRRMWHPETDATHPGLPRARESEETRISRRRRTVFACNQTFYADDHRVGAELCWHESAEVL